MTNEEKIQNRQVWEMRLQKFKESGMNQQEWCKSNELSYSTFRYWKRKFESEDLQKSGPDWIKIEATGDEKEKIVNFTLDKTENFDQPVMPAFVHTESLSAVIIHIGSFTIEVPVGANLFELSGILSVVKSIC